MFGISMERMGWRGNGMLEEYNLEMLAFMSLLSRINRRFHSLKDVQKSIFSIAYSTDTYTHHHNMSTSPSPDPNIHTYKTSRGLTYQYYHYRASSSSSPKPKPKPKPKPTLLFLHGFPLTAADWSYQITYFRSRGYSVLAPDLLGYGGSDKPAEPQMYRLKLMARDVLDILDREGLENERVVGVGHDWWVTCSSRFFSLQEGEKTKTR